VVQSGAISGLWSTTGHLLFIRPDGALFALAFDPGRLEARGSPTPVLEGISVAQSRAMVALSGEGTLVYGTGAGSAFAPEYRMIWKERDGREVVVDSTWGFRQTSYGDNAGWALSPDGRRVAIGLNTEAGDNIWVKHLPAGPVVRVTFDSASEYRPRWTPDGRAVIFGSNRLDQAGLYLRAADGTGSDSLILAGDIFEAQFSADGRWLVARGGGQLFLVGGRDIAAMRLGVDTAPTPLVATRFDESELALSPDGRWIAYVSDETGRPEVYLRPFPDAASAKYQVTAGGGVAPLWSRNGGEIFYVTLQRDLLAVPVTTGAAGPELGSPRVLFRLDPDVYLADREYYTPFDVSPDGRRFLMARRVSAEQQETSSLHVTLNWFEELRRQLGNR
jgi:hypothetical protein